MKGIYKCYRDIDVILQYCPINIVILNLLVYNSTIQYSNIAIMTVTGGGAVRVPTKSFDHGRDVCGAQAAGKWAEGRSVSLHVLHRSPEGVRHR